MAKLSSLASVSETRRVLDQFGLSTKKALGQHFLINDGVVSRICDLADITKHDCVVEVGPGIGTLTVALLQLAGSVISIERDSDLPAVLQQTCAPWAQSFTLLENDALLVQFEDLPQAPNKLVSNLPYAVAATIVLDFFLRFPSLESATVMVQAEVADRMCAQSGSKNYGAYTVKLGLLTKATGRFSVAEGNFFPPPRVKSAVVRLDKKEEMLPDDLLQATMVMADAAFATRRKTINNSMKTYFTNPLTSDAVIADHLPELFERAQIDPRVRGEALDEEAFIELGKAYLALKNK